jgi:hypothetical protein
VDLACPLVREDLKKVYRSKYIKEKVSEWYFESFARNASICRFGAP